MSWILAIIGFSALIVLHELGHFMAAKAVGMRVERFLLFFPPVLVKVRRGETEYGIGSIPLGGMVKITGMNPSEDLPDELRTRAYYSQPAWKRIVVIAAGPGVNLVVAFLLLWALALVNGTSEPTRNIGRPGLEAPAAAVLRPGDHIVSIDGQRGGQETISRQISSHKCQGKPVKGCSATTPAIVVVRRAGRQLTFPITPRYDSSAGHTRVGFSFYNRPIDTGPLSSARLSGDTMWQVTKGTVSAIARIFQPEQRKQLSGIVGISDVTHQAFAQDLTVALNLLAIISLSLALVNLFPFLPLDGGHIFWAVVEKVRGRPVPFSVMERAGVVGFALVLMLFFIGLSNDIGRLQGEGIHLR